MISRLCCLMHVCFTASILLFISGTPVPAQEWTTINKDYSSQRYVDLDQITPQNVGGLKESCEFQLNEASWFSSGLLIVDRTLFVDTMRATYAIDATTCALRWRTVLKFSVPANINNRGPAYLDGTIFRGTVDGRVVALDAKTGNILWDQQYADPKKGESFVAAPIAWKDKVFIGIAISDLGIQGRMLALDAKTGKEIWHFYTVPPGNQDTVQTWGGEMKRGVGGGGFWTSFSLDPATNELFIPVANPAPDFMVEIRPGENLYTDSVVSLNADTGKLNWYHQVTPKDDHDWDTSSPPTLYRSRRGKDMLVIADKTGFVTGINRTTKAVVFHTPGTTILNNGPLPETPTLTCPGLGGGSQFYGSAYQPEIGALYVGMVDWCSYYARPKPAPAAKPGGESAAEKGAMDYDYGGAVFVGFDKQPRGQITALDGESGRILWKYTTDGQMLAGLVPTKSGLVFAGDVRGNLFAFDAKSGSVLNRIDVNGALNGGLISYAVDGTQYIAAAVGGVTLNPAGVGGALKVSVYGLNPGATPKIVAADRLPPQSTGTAANAERYALMCGACHGNRGQGRTYPSLVNHPELADPDALGQFLATIPPPMPRLYPGPLDRDDLRMIAGYMRVITGGSTPQWDKIYSVLSSPRCLNCHTMTDFPRQTDARYAHIYGVTRGPDDKGAGTLRCTSCHESINNQVTGIPGAPDWHAAPLSMAWESAPRVVLSTSALCATFKDKAKNGNRDLAALEHHVATDPFVLWAWSPGSRPNGNGRLTPPITHEELVETIKEWEADGASCPTQ